MIWQENYKVGVKEIDKQHKELFEILNKLIRVVRDDDEDEEVKREKMIDTLEFMNKYVNKHFSEEERLQAEYDYPDLEEHQEIHRKFEAEIEEFQDEFRKNDYSQEFAKEFSGRLLTWLINHVADTDQKIGEYIKKKQNRRDN